MKNSAERGGWLYVLIQRHASSLWFPPGSRGAKPEGMRGGAGTLALESILGEAEKETQLRRRLSDGVDTENQLTT